MQTKPQAIGQRCQRGKRVRRRGTIIVLSAIMMVFMMALLAFAVDIGYVYVARDQLQRTADAAAISACWDLVDVSAPPGQSNTSAATAAAIASASQFAAYNTVLNSAPTLGSSDVTIGYLSNPSDPTVVMNTSGTNTPNAVTVRVQRANSRNGEVPFFFARTMGFVSQSLEAQATAALIYNVKGFTTPSDGSNLGMLPFALDKTTWDALIAGTGTDNWKMDSCNGSVTAGSDGVKECNLYPQGTGSPGNRGTVDIGSCSNSTADIARQIVNGISTSDLSHHGGKLELDATGKLYLNGDTGISAGVKDELASIIGEPRIIPIFQSVTGPGNNATYTIVQFAGVRIMEVKLTGSMSSKKVTIQPCNMISRGGIYSATPGTSSFIYSPVWLVR